MRRASGSGIQRGGHEQFLPGLQAEPDAHCNFRKLVEFIFVRTWGSRGCRCAHGVDFLVLSQNWAGRQTWSIARTRIAQF